MGDAGLGMAAGVGECETSIAVRPAVSMGAIRASPSEREG